MNGVSPTKGCQEQVGVPGRGIPHKAWKAMKKKARLVVKSSSIRGHSFVIKGTDSATGLPGFERPCGLTSWLHLS